MDLDFNQPNEAAPASAPTPIEPPVSPIGEQPMAQPVSEVPKPPQPVANPMAPLPPVMDNLPENPPVAPEGKKFPIIIVIVVIIVVLAIAVGAWYFLKGSNTDTPIDTNTVPLDTSTTTTTDTTLGTTPSTTTTTPAANDTKRKQDLATIKGYLDKYYSQNGSYPISNTFVRTSDSSSIISSALTPTFATTLPVDPLTPEYWYGYQSSDGTDYKLTARLEDTTDPAGALDGTVYLYTLTKSSTAPSSTPDVGTDFVTPTTDNTTTSTDTTTPTTDTTTTTTDTTTSTSPTL